MYAAAPTQFNFACIVSCERLEKSFLALGMANLVMANTQEIIMNKDQVKGRVEEVKGKVKEAAGVILDDKGMEIEGNIQKNVGKVQSALGDLKQNIEKIIKTSIADPCGRVDRLVPYGRSQCGVLKDF